MASLAAAVAVLALAPAGPSGAADGAAADGAPTDALAPAAIHSLLDCSFGSGQVFDIAYSKTGTLGVDRALVVSAATVPGQSAQNPAGPMNGVVAGTDVFRFYPSQSNPGSYELRLYDRAGVLKRVVDNTGTFELAGPDVLLYHGGGVTDTLIVTRRAWRYGETGSFAVTQENLINNEALQYTSCTGPWRMPAPERFTPLSPQRVLDTRDGAALGAAGERELALAGQHGVPATASAVALNLTVVTPAADGWIAAYPCGTTATTSTVNFVVGQTVANLTVVSPGAGGAVCLRSTVDTNLVVDLNGYLDAGGATLYVPVDPARALDTRESGGSLAAGGTVAVPVAGSYGTPHSATAAMLNVTVTNPAAAGYVTVYPCGAAVPLASNVNFAAGQTVANAAIGLLGEGGAVCIHSAAPTDLVVDVNGAFGPTGDTLPMALSPFRVADTRDSGVLIAGAVLEVALTGPSYHGVSASGALLNVTVTGADADGFLTVYPCGRARPWASHVNFPAGATVANFVLGGASASKVCIFSTATAHVVVDVSGVVVVT